MQLGRVGKLWGQTPFWSCGSVFGVFGGTEKEKGTDTEQETADRERACGSRAGTEHAVGTESVKVGRAGR
jgi:hypothetical protein